jgi:Ni,Fe-hydrogenase III small subunit
MQQLDWIHAPHEVQKVLIHLITNDVRVDIAPAVTAKLCSLVNECMKVMPAAQIIISTGINRCDKEVYNQRIIATNALLWDVFHGTKRVIIQDNSALSNNGRPLESCICPNDGFHLTPTGTNILTTNFRQSLECISPNVC